MTVRNLITQLLYMPMEYKVVLSIQKKDGEFEYFFPCGVVNYEDEEVGIIAELEDQE